MDAGMKAMIGGMNGIAIQAKSPAGATPQKVENFNDFLGSAIDKVNENLQTSGVLKGEFEKGNPDVSLAEVMIASQKASISFQAMLQVRNKLVNAYQEIMNIQI